MAAGAWVNLDIIGYHVGVPEKCFLSVTATVDDYLSPTTTILFFRLAVGLWRVVCLG